MSMHTNPETHLKKRISRLIVFFMVGLVVSGITAFPIETQLTIAIAFIDLFPTVLQHWLYEIYTAVKTTNDNYPYLSYGTDWLAFAHLVIAVAFIGPLRDPVRNIWVIQFGMIACVMIFPLAFIAGPIRGIPLFWTLIDCSFGLVGIIPLYWCYRSIQELEIVQIAKANPLSHVV